MIVIHVQVSVEAARRNEFLDLAREEVEASHSNPGCVKYACLEDVREQNAFTFYEEWESQQAFDAYVNSEKFQKMSAAYKALMAAPPQSSYYTATLLS